MPAGILHHAVNIQLKLLTNTAPLKEPGSVLKEFANAIPGVDTVMILFHKKDY